MDINIFYDVIIMWSDDFDKYLNVQLENPSTVVEFGLYVYFLKRCP